VPSKKGNLRASERENDGRKTNHFSVTLASRARDFPGVFLEAIDRSKDGGCKHRLCRAALAEALELIGDFLLRLVDVCKIDARYL
jgi:hypothetical protein